MQGYRPLLCVDSRSEHTGRAEEYPHPTLIHVRNDFLACLFCRTLLDESDFRFRYTVFCHQFFPNGRINVPFTLLISTQVCKDKLRAFLCIILLIIFVDALCCRIHLATGKHFILKLVNQPHIQSHLARRIGSDEHLRLHL